MQKRLALRDGGDSNKMINDYDRVTVFEGRLSPSSRCNIKSCNSIAKFLVFNDDGLPKMSRLFFCSCSKHLSLAVRKSWIENKERKRELDRKRKKEAKKAARKLLGIKK